MENNNYVEHTDIWEVAKWFFNKDFLFIFSIACLFAFESWLLLTYPTIFLSWKIIILGLCPVLLVMSYIGLFLFD